MKIQTLVSTMNEPSPTSLRQRMRLGSCLVVNQLTELDEVVEVGKSAEGVSVISVREKGLSKSRNLALLNTYADIAVVADDDMVYEPNYEDVVARGFKEYPDADIIAFRVDNSDGSSRELKAGRVSRLHTMKISSVQIALRPSSIKNKDVHFDERFGAGTVNYMGEESIFLMDCHRAGLKIYSYPFKIATLNDTFTTGSRNFNKQYFRVKGRVFKRMSKNTAVLLSLQFAVRKYQFYKREIKLSQAIAGMFEGLRKP